MSGATRENKKAGEIRTALLLNRDYRRDTGCLNSGRSLSEKRSLS
jgi:hypothetical protein